MNSFIYYFLQFTWGLPQNILGFLLWCLVKIQNPQKSFMFHKALCVYWKHKHHSMSLGMFLFLSDQDEALMVHEYGHTFQSVILGPFYLFIIGLPSLIWATHPHYIRKRRNKRMLYSQFYTEKWANHCGLKETGKRGIDY